MFDKKYTQVKTRSFEVIEILGRPPKWIIRYGISIVFGTIIILISFSWFISYPEVISSNISVTTERPPVKLISKMNGRITDLFFTENQNVRRGEIIAILENTLNYNDLKYLKKILTNRNNSFAFNDTLLLSLGELQDEYQEFTKLLSDYHNYINLGYYPLKIGSLEQQKEDLNMYYGLVSEQNEILRQSLHITKKQSDRDMELYNKGVYSLVDFESSKKKLLEHELNLKIHQTQLTSIRINMDELDQQILDLKLKESQEENGHRTAIIEVMEKLKGKIKEWEKKYLIRTPINGRITFTNVWSKNQNVKIGDIIATIVPYDNNIIGKITIPSFGVGKVVKGQTVIIKFDSYPFMEYGVVKGKIANISLVPSMIEGEVLYAAEVEIPDTLITNYGKVLQFSQEMSGNSEIITEDVRLIDRLLQPIKFIWRKNN